MNSPVLLAVEPWVLIGIANLLVVGMFFCFVVLLAKQYKRCPSNRVLVIYGKTGGRDSVRMIHGGAAFVIPLMQDIAYLNLEPIAVEVSLRDAPSADNVGVSVSAEFRVAIDTNRQNLHNAATRLLGLSQEEIGRQAEAVVAGRLRRLIGASRAEELVQDREAICRRIEQSAQPELGELGLRLLNVDVIRVARQPENREQPA
jgi:flotillin